MRAVIACDDVRTEVSGKSIMIGVYGPEIGVIQFPARLLIQFVPIVDLKSSGHHNIKMRIAGRDDIKFAEVGLDLEAPELATGVILPPIASPIVLNEKGEFRFEVEEDNCWRIVETWVVQATPQALSAPEK